MICDLVSGAWISPSKGSHASEVAGDDWGLTFKAAMPASAARWCVEVVAPIYILPGLGTTEQPQSTARMLLVNVNLCMHVREDMYACMRSAFIRGIYCGYQTSARPGPSHHIAPHFPPRALTLRAPTTSLAQRIVRAVRLLHSPRKRRYRRRAPLGLGRLGR